VTVGGLTLPYQLLTLLEVTRERARETKTTSHSIRHCTTQTPSACYVHGMQLAIFQLTESRNCTWNDTSEMYTVDRCSSAKYTDEFLIGAVRRTAPYRYIFTRRRPTDQWDRRVTGKRASHEKQNVQQTISLYQPAAELCCTLIYHRTATISLSRTISRQTALVCSQISPQQQTTTPMTY